MKHDFKNEQFKLNYEGMAGQKGGDGSFGPKNGFRREK